MSRPWRVGVLTLSDSRSPATDESGAAVRDALAALDGAVVVASEIVPDDADAIATALMRLADEVGCHLILTTGGTGLAPRDVTPEATMRVCDRLVPGFSEAMRAETLKKTPFAMLSRGVSALRGRCLIVNLPGSPKGVRECLEVIMPVLPHALKTANGDTAHG